MAKCSDGAEVLRSHVYLTNEQSVAWHAWRCMGVGRKRMSFDGDRSRKLASERKQILQSGQARVADLILRVPITVRGASFLSSVLDSMDVPSFRSF